MRVIQGGAVRTYACNKPILGAMLSVSQEASDNIVNIVNYSWLHDDAPLAPDAPFPPCLTILLFSEQYAEDVAELFLEATLQSCSLMRR